MASIKILTLEFQWGHKAFVKCEKIPDVIWLSAASNYISELTQTKRDAKLWKKYSAKI